MRAARRGAMWARNPPKPNISPSWCVRVPHVTSFYRSAATSRPIRSCSRLLVAHWHSCLWAVSVGGCHGRQVMSRTPRCVGCGGLERRSVVVACSLCSLGKAVLCIVLVVRWRFVPLLLSVCCVVEGARCADCCRQVGVGLAFAGSACSGGVPAAASSIVLVAVGGRARRPAPAVGLKKERGGAVGLGPCRAASRAAACCVLCGVDMRARVAVWSLGGLSRPPGDFKTATNPRHVSLGPTFV